MSRVMLEALEGLLVAVLLVPLELLVQWAQAALRALETLAWSALTSRS